MNESEKIQIILIIDVLGMAKDLIIRNDCGKDVINRIDERMEYLNAIVRARAPS